MAFIYHQISLRGNEHELYWAKQSLRDVVVRTVLWIPLVSITRFALLSSKSKRSSLECLVCGWLR